jgi:hypothetical protein
MMTDLVTVLAAVLVSVFAGPLSAQQILFKPGDDIREFFWNDPPKFMVPGQNYLKLPESRIDFAKYKTDTVDEDTKFIMQESNVIGVMQCENGKTTVFYDFDGDGILDAAYHRMVVPFWVLKNPPADSKAGKATDKKNGTDNFTQTLDECAAIFNDDTGPHGNGSHKLQRIADGIRRAFASVKTANRDLYYGLTLYLSMVQERSNAALAQINALEQAYISRFGKTHTLLSLYKLESTINMAEDMRAIWAAHDMARALAMAEPDFAPFLYYEVQTAPVPALRRDDKLRQDFPNHWMVKLLK